MAKYTPKFKESLKQAYLNGEGSLSAIAARFGVGERTVEMWAKDGGWNGLKKAQKVVGIDEGRKPRAIAPSQPKAENTPRYYQNPRSIGRREEIDEIAICEDAIYSLSLMISGTGELIDTRGIGGIAGALVRLLEYRRKIKPPTVADLAIQAIALGYSPDNFLQALNDEWRKQA